MSCPHPLRSAALVRTGAAPELPPRERPLTRPLRWGGLSWLALCWLLLGTLPPALRAQDPDAGSDATGEAAALAPRPARIAVIGASISSGMDARATRSAFLHGRPSSTLLASYNRRFDLKHFVSDLYAQAERPAEVRGYARIDLFNSPLRHLRQVDKAKRLRPDLVLAVDLPFWYGNGSPSRREKDGADGSSWRLLRQARLLKKLDELVAAGCRLIVGNYPDVHAAHPAMLPRTMIAPEDVRQELNRRLTSWAAQHPKVELIALDRWMAARAERGSTLPHPEGARHASMSELMSWDGLHPSPMGAAVFASWLEAPLRRAVQRTPAALPQAPLGLSHQLKRVGVKDAAIAALPKRAGKTAGTKVEKEAEAEADAKSGGGQP